LRLALNQRHRQSDPSQSQGRAHAGKPTTDHRHSPLSGNKDRLKWVLQDSCAHPCPNQARRLRGGRFVVALVYPGRLFAHIHVLIQVRVQSGLLHGAAEGAFMESGRTSGYHDAIDTLVPNVIDDQVLPRIGAHEDEVLRSDNVGIETGDGGHRLHIHDVRNVPAAVTDVDADLGLLAHAVLADLVLRKCPSASMAAAPASMMESTMSLGPLTVPAEKIPGALVRVGE
jgi:hypothetical protein